MTFYRSVFAFPLFKTVFDIALCLYLLEEWMRGWRCSSVMEHTCLAHRNPWPSASALCTLCMAAQVCSQHQEAKAGHRKLRVDPASLPSQTPHILHPDLAGLRPLQTTITDQNAENKWLWCPAQWTLWQHSFCSPSWRVSLGRGTEWLRTRGKGSSLLETSVQLHPIKSHQHGFVHKTWARESPVDKLTWEGEIS